MDQLMVETINIIVKLGLVRSNELEERRKMGEL